MDEGTNERMNEHRYETIPRQANKCKAIHFDTKDTYERIFNQLNYNIHIQRISLWLPLNLVLDSLRCLGLRYFFFAILVE